MIKPVAPGRPPVNRFVRQHIYCLTLLGPTRDGHPCPTEKYLVGEFRELAQERYIFTKIVDNDRGLPSHVFSIGKHLISRYQVHEVEPDEYPLFMGARYLSMFYRRLLAGEPMRIKKVSKIRRSPIPKRLSGTR